MSTEIEELKTLVEQLQKKVEDLEKGPQDTWTTLDTVVSDEFMAIQLITEEWASYKLDPDTSISLEVEDTLAKAIKAGYKLKSTHSDYEEFLKSDFYKSRL